MRHRVREGYISLEYAKKVYGVVIDTASELFSVDITATNELRMKIKEQRKREE